PPMPNTAAQIIPPLALAIRNVRQGMRFTPARNAANMRNSATKRPRNTTLAPCFRNRYCPEVSVGCAAQAPAIGRIADPTSPLGEFQGNWLHSSPLVKCGKVSFHCGSRRVVKIYHVSRLVIANRKIMHLAVRELARVRHILEIQDRLKEGGYRIVVAVRREHFQVFI